MRRRSPDIQKIIDQADALRNAGDLLGAFTLYRSIDERAVEDGPVQAMLSILASELEDASSAIRYSRRATALLPRSETASVVLFLALWDEGKSDEAFQEMQRFLKCGKAFEYRRILSDLGNGLREDKYDTETAKWIRQWLPRMALVLNGDDSTDPG